MVTMDFKLADIKLESSEAYLLKLGKNLSQDFQVIYIFCKNAVLYLIYVCRHLKRFYLKFDHFLLRVLTS